MRKFVAAASLALGVVLFGALCGVAAPARAAGVCADWPALRDGALAVDFGGVVRRYDGALRNQALWLDQFHAFIEEGAAAGLTQQAVADILLLGASVTLDTLGLVIDASGAAMSGTGEAVLKALERLKQGIDVAASQSVEEAAFRLTAERSGITRHTLASLDVFKSLFDAKDRFADRKETIAMLREAERALRRNLAEANLGLAKAGLELDDLNAFKNAMDARCHGAVASRAVVAAENAETCIARGRDGDGDRASHRLTNTCAAAVYVFWCYEGTTPRHSKPCGSVESYFTHNAVLQPGASRANYYSMPAGLGLKTGACSGGFGSAVFDGKGGYTCTAE